MGTEEAAKAHAITLPRSEILYRKIGLAAQNGPWVLRLGSSANVRFPPIAYVSRWSRKRLPTIPFAMKRYHFRTEEQVDARGLELASLAAAKCEAAKIAASCVCASADEAWEKCNWAVIVTDDDGRKIFQLQVIATE